MAEYHRLLEPNLLAASENSERDRVYDAGAYPRLYAQVRVVAPGSAGTIALQHAAVKEADAWLDLSGTSVNLNALSNNYIEISGFLRYIRWTTDGAVAGSPKGIIDTVAKEA